MNAELAVVDLLFARFALSSRGENGITFALRAFSDLRASSKRCFEIRANRCCISSEYTGISLCSIGETTPFSQSSVDASASNASALWRCSALPARHLIRANSARCSTANLRSPSMWALCGPKSSNQTLEDTVYGDKCGVAPWARSFFC